MLCFMRLSLIPSQKLLKYNKSDLIAIINNTMTCLPFQGCGKCQASRSGRTKTNRKRRFKEKYINNKARERT